MTLRIQLAPLDEMGPDTALEWELVNAAREVVKRGVSTLRELPKNEPSEVVLAAPDVLLLDIALPNFSHAKLHLVLPSLVEDTLLGDVENAFLVTGPRDQSGRGTVAAVDRGRLRHVMELLARAGLRVRSAVPEPLTLAITSQCWRIRLRERYACVRTGARMGFATSVAEPATPPPELLLALAQARAQPPEFIEIEGVFDEGAWASALGPVSLRRVKQDEVLSVPTDVELLRYEFSPRLGDWKVWRPALITGMAFVLVSLLGLNLHAWQLSRESDRLQAEIESVFKQSFPSVRAVLDPVLQMRRAVDMLRGARGSATGSDFLGIAAGAAGLINRPDVVQAMEYANGVLRLDLASAQEKDKAWQEQVMKAAAQAGFAASFSGAQLIVKPKVDK